jgi:hypothetical protein
MLVEVWQKIDATEAGLRSNVLTLSMLEPRSEPIVCITQTDLLSFLLGGFSDLGKRNALFRRKIILLGLVARRNESQL